MQFLYRRSKEEDEKYARKIVRDAQMRKELYRMLWNIVETKKVHGSEIPIRPFPDMDDKYYRDELKRILGL